MKTLFLIAALALPSPAVASPLYEWLHALAHQADCPPATTEPMGRIPDPPAVDHETQSLSGNMLCASPVSDKASEPTNPLPALTQAVVEANAAVKSASDALTAALPIQAAANKAFVDECVKQGIIVPGPGPSPTPTPAPSGPAVSLLVVTSPETCPPCKKLQPVLDRLKSAGMPIKLIDGGDPAAAVWKVPAIPTFVMTIGGVEVPAVGGKDNRFVGVLSEASIVDWIKGTQSWVNEKYPQVKSADYPPPPVRSRP